MSVSTLPLVNACLNSLSFLLLLWGRVEIARGNRGRHKKIMTAALISSAVFLSCYLYYHFNTQIITRYQGEGIGRILYYAMLISHIILAIAMLPGIFYIVFQAFKGNFRKHKRFASLVWWVWAYVSLTGVLVYLALNI